MKILLRYRPAPQTHRHKPLGMSICYCEACGFRVIDEDLKSGDAIETLEGMLCAKCVERKKDRASA
jgi:hypothetical protein